MKRNTIQKEIIINTIKKHGHLTKEELINIILNDYPSISASTIYRNLFSLKEDEIIRECSIDNLGSIYEVIFDEHDHFICNSCGMIKDIPKVDKNIIIGNNIKEINSFKINYYQINYYGVCDICLNKDKE